MTGAPKLRFHNAFISTHIVSKFQLCRSSGFYVINELINFQAKNRRFICFLGGSQFTITLARIPQIGTHDSFINSFVESKFQLSRFYCLLVMSKSILICQNLPTKTKVLHACAKSQLMKNLTRLPMIFLSSLEISIKIVMHCCLIIVNLQCLVAH